MAKAVCVNASARACGSCSYILDTVSKGLEASGAVTERINISEINMEFCHGCKKCYEKGVCVIKDDVYETVRKLLSADLVIIASPSYWGDVPGQMKTFFDRNTPFGDTNEYRVLKTDKRILGVSIAVRAGNSERENKLILDYIEHYYGHMGITPVKRFSVRNTDSLADLLNKHASEIAEFYEYGKKLASEMNL